MSTVIYISHPEVEVDPDTPVPQWSLSATGVARMEAFCGSGVLSQVASVWCSCERKATMGAEILSRRLGLGFAEIEALGENDRSATGFVRPPRFWDLVDAFFSKPDESIEGWETARDAQKRIVGALQAVCQQSPDGDIALVAHGGVGALTLAYLNNQPISRNFDQPNQGNWFAFDRQTFRPKTGWLSLETTVTLH